MESTELKTTLFSCLRNRGYHKWRIPAWKEQRYDKSECSVMNRDKRSFIANIERQPWSIWSIYNQEGCPYGTSDRMYCWHIATAYSISFDVGSLWKMCEWFSSVYWD